MMTSFLAERRLPKVSTRTDRLAGAMVKAKANAKNPTLGITGVGSLVELKVGRT